MKAKTKKMVKPMKKPMSAAQARMAMSAMKSPMPLKKIKKKMPMKKGAMAQLVPPGYDSEEHDW